MSRRKAIASKVRKTHPLLDALRELRDTPWPAPGAYKEARMIAMDACGLPESYQKKLMLAAPATAASAEFESRTTIAEWRYGRWASTVVVPIRLTGGAGTP